ncbi:helix-turn-helix domain-containing protein [Microbacterium rhizosphaerae]|uniref:Helix-turn-helix transcriptional regulator n=1 Tax=Microbacterium rhizosphaerae TaxID=1678237 RepID=A0ABZ0SPC8_9MICO|nr:helix-turn-helix transcriptional regulator [Microbacterium rhizosphaerae]WPR89107.1 helix-turn-helix transcriptional regulator [Microbacterium rhizosphaerae]
MIDDELIGRNLTVLRGTMSQKELAERMRKLGFKWSQATVWSIEKGERPLRLTESEALGSVFGIHAQALTLTEQSLSRVMRARELDDALTQIADLAYASFERQRRLAMAYDMVAGEDDDEDFTPELFAHNAVDYALQGLARAEAHLRGEFEVEELLYGPFPHEGHDFQRAFIARVRAQIEELRQRGDTQEEAEDGVDQATQ